MIKYDNINLIPSFIIHVDVILVKKHRYTYTCIRIDIYN